MTSGVGLLGQQAADVWHDWAPLVSTGIAVVSLGLALLNRRTSKQALEISARQEDRRTARLDLTRIDAIRWRVPNEQATWIGVNLRAVNPTDRDGTIITADLHLTYKPTERAEVVVQIAHSEAGTGAPGNVTPLAIPCSIGSNGAIVGWLTFRVDDALVGDGTIERYEVIVHDSRGLVERLEAWNLREVTDGQAT